MLMLLRRLTASSGISNTPFHAPQECEVTLRRYGRRVSALVAFLLRDKGDYKLSVPKSITKHLEKVRAHLALGPNSHNDRCHAVHNLLVALWTTEWPPSIRGEISDPTICFLALSSINNDGTFAEAYQVTNPISSLEFCMRAVFLIEMHKNMNKKKKGNLLVHCDKLARWFTEKYESTFNSLRSLQHRATTLALSTTAMPRLFWRDEDEFNVMFFDGNKIDFTLFPDMFMAMEKDLIDLWENKVLRGLKIFIKYDELRDDLANKSDQYSFLVHPQNKCFSKRDSLLEGIIENSALSATFLTNIIGPDGGRIWNIIELRRWLLDYATFHSVLFTRAEMTAGSPARSTEVSCIEYCNTKARQGRGCYVMGKYLAILCRYHKSQNMTSKDKLIPHATDAFTTSLIIQDLAIARPFAELAVHICFPNRLDMQSLYRTYLFVNNGLLFRANDISKQMRFYTGQTLGYEIGISDWRHISIALWRKHCPRILNMVAECNTNTVQAMQASHTTQTENRIYGLDDSATVTGADLELQAFLVASTDWQHACHVMPGGTTLPYFESTTEKYANIIQAKKAQDPLDKIAERIIAKLELKSPPVQLEQLMPQLEKMIVTSMENAISESSVL